jgi:hypothetical protein
MLCIAEGVEMRISWIMAAVGLAMFATGAQAADTKWRATLVLVTPDERTCGNQHVVKFDVSIDGNIVRYYSPSGAAHDFRLLAPLNADGSGKVKALNSKNREVTLDIDAGDGPRTIRITPPYHFCVWAWVPIRS